mmetsp:Transcript_83440/g.232732  ORF Transcript_83440/g.232732 Transcript_83440/m.232732 type:complete len:214 (-) Transcript_83440:1230-1871(-)
MCRGHRSARAICTDQHTNAAEELRHRRPRRLRPSAEGPSKHIPTRSSRRLVAKGRRQRSGSRAKEFSSEKDLDAKQQTRLEQEHLQLGNADVKEVGVRAEGQFGRLQDFGAPTLEILPTPWPEVQTIDALEIVSPLQHYHLGAEQAQLQRTPEANRTRAHDHASVARERPSAIVGRSPSRFEALPKTAGEAPLVTNCCADDVERRQARARSGR